MNARILDPLAPSSPESDGSRTIPAGDAFDLRLSLVELIVCRGNEPPLHQHRHEDVLVYVVAGDLLFHVDGARERVSTGSCLLLPRGTEHGYTILSERAHMLVLLAPSGAEDFLTDLHDPGNASAMGGAGRIERLISTAARHGIEVTGPPPGRD